MKCYICSSRMDPTITNLPFKVSRETIVILKNLPVLQCSACREFFLNDDVMEEVDNQLETINETAELEILKYAA